MSRLVLTASQLNQLRSKLLDGPHEACAILVGHAVTVDEKLARLVVREIIWPAEQDYLLRSDVAAQLKPEFIATLAQRVCRTGESLVFVHTHPFPLNRFSAIDDAGERVLSSFLDGRRPGVTHAAMLLTPEVAIARILGGRDALNVMGVGATLEWGAPADLDLSDAIFDRQIRAFGAAGQARLSQMRVAIVGLGGTGSIVLEQLSHLGVGQLLLMDPDVVESTNLNRLVGASSGDVHRLKVDVAADLARRINPLVQIETTCESVLLATSARRLTNADLVFACTDSQGSRAVLNQLAYHFLVPVIDMGTAIHTAKERVVHIAGKVQMLAPGLGCKVCGNLLDPEAVRVDLLSDFERRNDQYIVGAHEPAPAVISLNATMSSQAVTMFLAAAVGIPSAPRMLNYDAMTGVTRPAAVPSHPTCYVCSPTGGLARADEWPLNARKS